MSILDTLRGNNDALRELIRDDAEIHSLPENSSGSERSLDELTAEELSAIPQGLEPAAILPLISIEESAVYVFGLSLDNLAEGEPITLQITESRPTNRVALRSAQESSGAHVFIDDDGKEITSVSANKHVNIAAYFEGGKTYSTLILTGEAENTSSHVPESPDVRPSSPDIVPASPDIKPVESPDVRPSSPDIVPESLDVQPVELPDTKPVTSPDITNIVSHDPVPSPVASPDPEPAPNVPVSSGSGGGCNSGANMWPLLGVIILKVGHRRRN